MSSLSWVLRELGELACITGSFPLAVSEQFSLALVSSNRKTTLISALTLDALYGKAIGEVTLNGVPINDKVFKSHCYVVKQHDKHWPYLTCRETLRYAAELFDVAPTKEDLELLLEEIMQKMGLTTVADSRNSAMSGGQRRRLSIGIALLKQPTLVS